MYYKLTDRDGCSFGDTQWGRGVTHKAEGEGTKFCSPDLIHLYSHPLLAVLLNPTHADFPEPLRLWETEVVGKVYEESGLKFGAKQVMTTREVPVPVITAEQRMRFAILCTKEVYFETAWNKWADMWLAGEDRTLEAVAKARAVVEASASSSWAAWAAWASAWAMAAEVADWVAAAAEKAASATGRLNLIALAERACSE